MTSVRTRALAVLLAVAPAAGLLAGSPAQADPAAAPPALPKVNSVSVSPAGFVLSAKAGCRNLTLTAVLSAALPTTGYDFIGVGADLFAPGKSSPADGVQFHQVGSSTTTYRGTLKICGKYTAGTWRAEVYGAAIPTGGSDSDLKVTNKVKVGVSLKRPSVLAFNASPEPAKKGKQITAAGTLKIDGKTLSGAAVKIYFEASGTKTYVLKANATTNGKGAFSKKFTATKSGVWKAVYAGSSTRNAATAYDGVQVK